MDVAEIHEAEEHLTSVLGTKQFWDERYSLELKNYHEHNDEGEVWFGRSAENRLITYLIKAHVSPNASIVDLGCGNGSLLRRLRHKGFHCLTGVDYCMDAVALARSIAENEAKHSDKLLDTITFEVVDLLDIGAKIATHDIALDKGTWDAMSLSEDRDQRLVLYRSLIIRILNKRGIFIIFSCNFTKEELCKRFAVLPLRFKAEIASEHSFTFGGRAGLTSTGVVFEKVDS